ncbi:MAG: hypothetical protein WC389_12805 [Lutibacter sp.]|jgi:hypothetical protein
MEFKVVAKPVIKVERKKDEYQQLVETLIGLEEDQVVQLKFQNYKAVYDKRAVLTQKVRSILKPKNYKLFSSIVQVEKQFALNLWVKKDV